MTILKDTPHNHPQLRGFWFVLGSAAHLMVAVLRNVARRVRVEIIQTFLLHGPSPLRKWPCCFGHRDTMEWVATNASHVIAPLGVNGAEGF